MKRQALDIYDDMPRAMQAYISNFGWNFNKKACEYAVSLMRKKFGNSEKVEPIEPWTKEQVDKLLKKYGLVLENDVMYNATYVCNDAVANCFKSSIPDEVHLAMHVKDVLDDVDGCDELPFRFWVQKMVAMGMPIEWEDLM
ncbi:MAG: hypothetical protein MJZ30_12405 [Paludibacteraceae bacterium]|nr:hypothetical protein [Paludibacteraceae bacterium]